MPLGHLQLITEGLRPCGHDDGERDGSGTQTDAFDLTLPKAIDSDEGRNRNNTGCS